MTATMTLPFMPMCVHCPARHLRLARYRLRQPGPLHHSLTPRVDALVQPLQGASSMLGPLPRICSSVLSSHSSSAEPSAPQWRPCACSTSSCPHSSLRTGTRADRAWSRGPARAGLVLAISQHAVPVVYSNGRALMRGKDQGTKRLDGTGVP